MSAAFLIQLLISAVAVAALVGLAAWLGVPRPAPALDEDHARALLAEEFPEADLGKLWIAADGMSALARSGEEGLIVYRAGDGYVIRSAPWSAVRDGVVKGDRAVLKLDDVAAPRAVFALPEGASWPPSALYAKRGPA
jgi:hypothetical protein